MYTRVRTAVRSPGGALPTYQGRALTRPLGDAVDDAFLAEAVELAMPYYQKRIKKLEPWLKGQGRKVGKAAVAAAKGAVFDPKPEKPSGPPWLPKLTDPILNPFIDGMQQEILPTVTGVAAGFIGLLVGTGFVLGLLVGRR